MTAGCVVLIMPGFKEWKLTIVEHFGLNKMQPLIYLNHMAEANSSRVVYLSFLKGGDEDVY